MKFSLPVARVWKVCFSPRNAIPLMCYWFLMHSQSPWTLLQFHFSVLILLLVLNWQDCVMFLTRKYNCVNVLFVFNASAISLAPFSPTKVSCFQFSPIFLLIHLNRISHAISMWPMCCWFSRLSQSSWLPVAQCNRSKLILIELKFAWLWSHVQSIPHLQMQFY